MTVPVKTNYVLIDFENVQPRNLNVLEKHPFQVIVFVGASQSKIPIELAEAMQKLGAKSRYVRISGNGKNALDFHVAYYLGMLNQQEPGSFFHVISKDTGFDPLIKHLRKEGVKAHRHNDLEEIPELRISASTTNNERVAAIVNNLAGRGQSRPRKLKTLCNTINSLFTKKLADDELNKLIEELRKRSYIKVSGQNVSYQLPKSKRNNS